jgi:S1-C subfamily serine protease
MKLLLLINFLFNVNALTPKTKKELRSVAVKITDTSMGHGGTGSILKSGKESIILTNKHVCEVVKEGGFVIRENLIIAVNGYKEYPAHDLCLVKVRYNFGLSLKLANRAPLPSETSLVTGFPMLMPNTITVGHFSDVVQIPVVIGMEDCAEDDQSFECVFFGGKPIVRHFVSQYTSNLIQPGNSGSAVFNKQGELSGVVFAGSGEIGFAFIVPYAYVVHFVSTHENLKWKEPILDKDKKEKNTETAVEDFRAECASINIFTDVKVKELCRKIKTDLIYREGETKWSM